MIFERETIMLLIFKTRIIKIADRNGNSSSSSSGQFLWLISDVK